MERYYNVLWGNKFGGVDWIHLTEYGPVAGCCEHGSKYFCTTKGGDFLTSLVTVSFSRRTLLLAIS
jgi:hypothetical protein